MKLWVDDVRESPEGFMRAYSVNEAKVLIETMEKCRMPFEYIDIDHDAGDFAKDGGDYIKLLDWLEETGRKYPIRIHSMNSVGVENMRAIVEKNGWELI